MDTGKRMIVMLALNLLMFVATAGFAIYFLDAVRTEMHDIAAQDLPITNALSGATTHQLEQAILMERVARLARAKTDHNQALRRQSIRRFDELNAKVDKELEDVTRIAESAVLVAHSDKAKLEFLVL